jgi:site-specific recombinase XerD
MHSAGVSGAQASPKGLRHGFGVAAVQAVVPLNLVQRWLGHADLATTAIYVDAVGIEERDMVARIWVLTEQSKIGDKVTRHGYQALTRPYIHS